MPSPLRVLHLEDSARDAEVVRHKLDAGGLSCDVRLVNSKEQFRSRADAGTLRSHPLRLQPAWLRRAAALKHAQLVQPDVPVIIISGTVRE